MNDLRLARTGVHQRGMSMIEVVGALAIASAMTVGLAGIATMSVEDTKAQQTATYHAELHKGVTTWMAVAANRSAVIAAANTTTPYKITLVSLQPYLPAGFGATNPYLQSPCVLAYYDSTKSRIEVAVTSEGGTVIDDGQLGYIVAHAGTGAGAIYASAPTIARGAFGGWQAPVSTYTSGNAANRCAATQANAGHLLSLLPFDETGLYSMTGAGEWLARNVIPGRPELNRMNTTLDMGDNRLVNLQDLYEVPATACTVAIEGRDGKTSTGQPRRCLSGVWAAVTCGTGDLAVDSTGKVSSCQGGLWKAQGSAYWEDPIDKKVNLDAITCNASILGQTRVVRDASDGAGRPRAYTCNGTAWTPLALDENGNLSIPGTLNVTGTATLARVDGTLEVASVAVAGGACAPNKRLAMDANGGLLSCKSGLWTAPGGGSYGGGYMVWRVSGGCAQANPRTGACNCPAGFHGIFVGMAYNSNPWDLVGIVCN